MTHSRIKPRRTPSEALIDLRLFGLRLSNPLMLIKRPFDTLRANGFIQHFPRMKRGLPLLGALLLFGVTGCETYPRHADVRVHDRDYDVRIVFSDRDRGLIRDYFVSSHPHGMPPGLARKGKLPPGHAMRLNRGAPLPQGYSSRPMPRDLDGRLSRLPEGYVRVIVGGDIGIMNVRTRVILDVIEDIAD